jgi:Pvc16 N-terminal domain/Carboxypeptidase regulatory-like domain
MIRDLSATLDALLTQPGLPLELAAAQIIFDRPTEPFNPPQTTVDLFLYDIRENVELRSNEPLYRRPLNQQFLDVEPPPMRIACSYLVTAWPVGGADLALQEHRLLSQVLQMLSHFPTIPPQFLQGSLVGQEPPLPMMTAQTDAVKNPAEFWTAIGNRLRASLNVTVTISVPVLDDVTTSIVTTIRTGYDLGEGVSEVLIQIGGRVTDLLGNAVSNALVDVLNAGLRTQTDADGRYSFDSVPSGPITVRTVAVGFQPKTQVVSVPGKSEDYEIALTPL